jgi:hypothetical protein
MGKPAGPETNRRCGSPSASEGDPQRQRIGELQVERSTGLAAMEKAL